MSVDMIDVEVIGGPKDGLKLRGPEGVRFICFPLLRSWPDPLFEFEAEFDDVLTPHSITLPVFRCDGCGKYWVDGRDL